jgi:molybdopterin converting factor small subunit
VITVRYFAGARAAAGVPEDEVPPGCTLDQLVAALVARRGARLAPVLQVASLLVDGVAWRERDRPLPDPAVVDVLPPFAGG